MEREFVANVHLVEFPHGDMAVDSRSKGAIDLEGEEVSYLYVQKR
jgi:hypothetical protein